ncbi:NTP transferase domain-containing protein [Candidatus Pelagibacter bacterium nBUS_49]|uniref:NTP transferase domain-containing protein n=1 Tax=Candidatus Pelagibacter bacterium nBUS_49 TaxID=3374196 RepID=UPI003EBF3708
MKIVILAAGKSSRIYEKIKKNKCLIDINGESLIQNSIKKIIKTKKVREEDIYIVTGYKPDLIKSNLRKNFKNINFIYNKYFQKKEMLYSMILAMKQINDNFICLYSDILFTQSTLNKLMRKKYSSNIKITILKNWQKIWRYKDKSIYKDAENLKINYQTNLLQSIGQKIIKDIPKYQYMGMLYIPKLEFKSVFNVYSKFENKRKMHLTMFLNKLIKNKIKVYGIPTSDFWYEFDDYDDYKNFLNLNKIL